jgi:hypothetical protein
MNWIKDGLSKLGQSKKIKNLQNYREVIIIAAIFVAGMTVVVTGIVVFKHINTTHAIANDDGSGGEPRGGGFKTGDGGSGVINPSTGGSQPAPSGTGMTVTFNRTCDTYEAGVCVHFLNKGDELIIHETLFNYTYPYSNNAPGWPISGITNYTGTQDSTGYSFTVLGEAGSDFSCKPVPGTAQFPSEYGGYCMRDFRGTSVPTTSSADFYLRINNTLSPGDYHFTLINVKGVDTWGTDRFPFIIRVGYQPTDFSLTCETTTQSVVAGGSAAYTIRATSVNNFTGQVNVAVNGLHSSMSSNAPITLNVPAGGFANSPPVVVNTQIATPEGTYPLTFKANASGFQEKTCTANLDVSKAQGPQVQLVANPISVTPGGTTTLSWTVQNADTCVKSLGAGGWSGTIAAADGNQSGVAVNSPQTTYRLTCSRPGFADAFSEATVVVSFVPAPSFTVNPSSYSFTAQLNNSASIPAAKNFTITNNGNVDLNFTVSSDRSWLTLGSNSVPVPQGQSRDVSVRPNTASGLSPNPDTSQVTFNSNSTAGSVNRPVTYSLSAPSFTVTPSSYSFTAQQNNPASIPAAKNFTITNTGNIDLTFSISNDRSWLTLGLSSIFVPQGQSRDVSVQPNTASGLSPNPDTSQVTFNSNSTAGSVNRSVTYNLTAATSFALSCNPSLITFNPATDPPPPTFTVTASSANPAGVNQPITIAASSVPGGLSFTYSPNSINPAGPTTSTVSISGWAPSTSYQINVTGTAAGVTVTGCQTNLNVGAAPIYSFTATGTLNFSATQNAALSTVSPSQSQNITLTNTGNQSLSITRSPNAIWHTSSPADPIVIAPGGTATVTITISSTNPSPLTTSNTITFSAVNATPKQTVVNYAVTPQPPSQPTVIADNSVTCATIKITWSQGPGPVPEGYRVYRSASNSPYNWVQLGANVPQSAPHEMIDSSPLNPSSLNYYSVIAYIGSSDGPRGFASASPRSCQTEIQGTDKDITNVNNSAISGNIPCNGSPSDVNAPPGGGLFKVGDVLTFKINLCNSSTATANLTNASVSDNGSNLSNFTGFQFTNSCNKGSVSSTTNSFTVTIDDLPPGTVCSITFKATITAPANPTETVYRFQNKGTLFGFDAGRGINISQDFYTSPILFTLQAGSPKREEVAP